jgi:hypothetical protein
MRRADGCAGAIKLVWITLMRAHRPEPHRRILHEFHQASALSARPYKKKETHSQVGMRVGGYVGMWVCVMWACVGM